jgi:tartrate/fumarate subfamily iron-sulfur-dependent hydro-lyase beta chain
MVGLFQYGQVGGGSTRQSLARRSETPAVWTVPPFCVAVRASSRMYGASQSSMRGVPEDPQRAIGEDRLRAPPRPRVFREADLASRLDGGADLHGVARLTLRTVEGCGRRETPTPEARQAPPFEQPRRQRSSGPAHPDAAPAGRGCAARAFLAAACFHRNRGTPYEDAGPTTAGRMDSYVDLFQSKGGSMVMLAKGNRSGAVTAACKKHGGFYLGSIGGPAARLAKDCIRKVEVLEYPELGMEAVWQIEVEDFPAFIVVDDKGHDFFAGISGEKLPVVS